MNERRQAEATLAELMRQHDLILRSAGEGICALDLEGRTTFANPAAAQMIGWEVEELLGQPQHAILHHSKPDGSPYPREKCPISAAFKDGAVHHIDTEVFWRKDGTSFPVAYTSTPIRDEQGRLAGAVVTFRDITKRKRFQDTLSKSEREHRLVTDNVPALIACVDKDGRYVLANRQYEEWFGVTNDQLIGRHVREVLTEASYQAAQPYVEQALSGQEAAFELQIPHKDGSRRWISATYVPKLEEDGRVGGFYALVLDVTGRRRAEVELRRVHDELEARVAERTAGLASANKKLKAEITERKQAEEALGTKTAQLQAVSEAMTTFLEEENWQAASAKLLRSASCPWAASRT